MGFRARQKLGKYRLERRLAEGGFAAVYQAYDTVEGIRVALKIPFPTQVTPATLADFRREARLTASLDHPNILPIKNAALVDGHFVIALPLGQETLEDRMKRRMTAPFVLDCAEQVLEALAYAHGRRIIHCDVKPDNVIMFSGKQLRLTDFGIAKVAQRNQPASGSGTVGYMAPEQAMGRPTFASDVFSMGLMLFRMLTGKLPEWPYRWPLVGHDKLRRKVSKEVIEVLEKSLTVDVLERYRDAGQMLSALRRARQSRSVVRLAPPPAKSSRRRAA